VKFIEEQLANALKETPHETDCSLSAAVMESAGVHGPDAQRTWLEARRPAREGKSWYRDAEHWTYSESLTVSQDAPRMFSLPLLGTRPPIVVPKIVVKPLPWNRRADARHEAALRPRAPTP
jgi:hypothetical protein